MKKTIEERFEEKVDRTGDCHLWTGCKNRGGYGRFWYKKSLRAHRFVWVLANGPVPEGMHVLHRCDNRSCVNPEHLFLGTHADNMADRNKKGRQAKGTKINTNVLTEKQVLKIRKDDRLQRIIAEEYGVGCTVISYIKNRITWKHI